MRPDMSLLSLHTGYSGWDNAMAEIQEDSE